MSALLDIDGLTVELPVETQMRTVLKEVSLSIAPGQALGLVGESGSGKSMTARAVARLLPAGAHVAGAASFDGASINDLSGKSLRAFRNDVAMVFQDPRAHVNPVRTIGDFMGEALRTNRGVSREEARSRAVAALDDVGIQDGERRLAQYPHELSGGLLQRVMIATMLLTEPRLVLADEPTTALDVTTQSEVMAILDELRQRRGLAMLFITHDLELAAAVCDRIAVMYAGQIVETRASSKLHDNPLHPYTSSLSAARPSIDVDVHRLAAIPGRPVSAYEAPDGCSFAPRCPYAEDRCRSTAPSLVHMDGDDVRCLRAAELRGELSGKIEHA